MSYPNHIDGECISLERYALTVLAHFSRITDGVWRVQISIETFCPGAATAILLFCIKQDAWVPEECLVLKKRWDEWRRYSSHHWCKSGRWHRKTQQSVLAHRLPTGLLWVLKNCTVESTGSLNSSCGENWWGKMDVLKYLSYLSYLLPVHRSYQTTWLSSAF